MIVVVNLICPQGHPVEGMLAEVSGCASGDVFDRIGRNFNRLLKKHPPEPCSSCGATFNPNSSDRQHLARWAIAINEMKAATMEEAKRALDTVGKGYEVEIDD